MIGNIAFGMFHFLTVGCTYGSHNHNVDTVYTPPEIHISNIPELPYLQGVEKAFVAKQGSVF